MQYMLMCCIDEREWNAMPADRRDEVMREYGEFIQGIVRSGHYRASGKLQAASTGRTVRERAGRLVTTDGPFAETKEQLGGYHLVECKDLAEAVALAGRIPTLRVGGVVEVRPMESSIA
jgi:hypothetical protein